MPRRNRRHPYRTNGTARASGQGKRAAQRYSLHARREYQNVLSPAPNGALERAGRWLKTGALASITYSLTSLLRGNGTNGDVEIGKGAGLGLAALLNALDWDNVRAEVDRESRAHAVLMGGKGAGKTTLLYRLKGFMPKEIRATEEIRMPEEIRATEEIRMSEEIQIESEGAESEREWRAPDAHIENLGFFAVIDVPAASPNGTLNESSAILLELESADLVVWVLDAEQGLRTWEYEWIQRVRALGKSILIAANKMDRLASTDALQRWARVLGCEILPIAAATGMNLVTLLLPRLADASPSLATALGREITSWRRTAAARAMRRAAVLSGLTGLEPIPLLDLPFQIFIQLQMVLRIGAIYGQPLTDRYSREMLATMVSAVALRMGGQQLMKVIPFVGWAASGALAAAGTWTIGRIAVEYFERGRKVWGRKENASEGRIVGWSDGQEMERGSEGEIENERKRDWRLEIGDWRGGIGKWSVVRWVGNLKRRLDVKGWVGQQKKKQEEGTEGSGDDGAAI
mgnify:CR=1 FL=1